MNSSALFFNVRALWPPKPVARHRGVARWHAFTEHALDRQNMNVAQRLLAPMLVNRRSYGPAPRGRAAGGRARARAPPPPPQAPQHTQRVHITFSFVPPPGLFSFPGSR